VALTAAGAGWRGAIDYNVDLFDASTMTALASRFADMLQRGLTEPDLPLSAIGITTPEERRALRAWNQAEEAVPPGTPVEAIRQHARHAPDAGSRAAAARRERPVTATEAILLSIWREVLNQPALGPDDNFFDAGGDSISSIQIVTRARQRGLALEPRQVFEMQTIAELARIARQDTDNDPPRDSAATNGGQTPPEGSAASESFPLASGLTQTELDAIRRRWDLPT
jgi:non-ribosomal peptide synthetase component F